MTQAQVSYTDSCPLVLRYPVSGSLESVRLSSDVRERLIVECFTNNGVAGVKFREDGGLHGMQCLGEDQEGGKWVQGERVVILLILSLSRMG